MIKVRTKNLIFALFACLPIMILFTLFYLIPMFTTIVTSFFDWSQIQIQGFAGIDNYIRLFNDPVFYISLRNNISWLAFAVFVHIPFALLIALLLSERLRGWKILRTAYFIPQIISSVAWATIFLSVFNPRYGLINGLLEIFGSELLHHNWLFDASTAWLSIIATWLFHIGMYSMIILAELISIPDDIIESAQIDGAGKIKLALQIKLPMVKFATTTVLILAVTGGIRHFDSLFVMTNGAPNFRTNTLALYLYQQYSYADFSYANTIGVFLLVFGMIIVTLVRWLMRSRDKV